MVVLLYKTSAVAILVLRLQQYVILILALLALQALLMSTTLLLLGELVVMLAKMTFHALPHVMVMPLRIGHVVILCTKRKMEPVWQEQPAYLTAAAAAVGCAPVAVAANGPALLWVVAQVYNVGKFEILIFQRSQELLINSFKSSVAHY